MVVSPVGSQPWDRRNTLGFMLYSVKGSMSYFICPARPFLNVYQESVSSTGSLSESTIELADRRGQVSSPVEAETLDEWQTLSPCKLYFSRLTPPARKLKTLWQVLFSLTQSGESKARDPHCEPQVEVGQTM